jgi:hypothetical protein
VGSGVSFADAVSTRAALRALWIAVGVQLAGRLLDLRWHLANDEFEGTSQQLEAHWLLWLGVLATIAVAAVAIAAKQQPAGQFGYQVTLLSGLLYVPVSIWHFIEHANNADPELAHVLLGLTQIGMVVGAIVATVIARRGRRPEAGAPGAAAG